MLFSLRESTASLSPITILPAFFDNRWSWRPFCKRKSGRAVRLQTESDRQSLCRHFRWCRNRNLLYSLRERSDSKNPVKNHSGLKRLPGPAGSWSSSKESCRPTLTVSDSAAQNHETDHRNNRCQPKQNIDPFLFFIFNQQSSSRMSVFQTVVDSAMTQ